MERLWAPWCRGLAKADEPRGCIFCEKAKEKRDEENLIVYRGKKNFIILNSSPYNPGHLIVAPYNHVAEVKELTPEEMTDHMEIIVKAMQALDRAFSPAGFNMGMNIGRVAGDGTEDHIHSHVVPRWRGDANFISVLADTRVLWDSSQNVYQKLKEFLV